MARAKAKPAARPRTRRPSKPVAPSTARLDAALTKAHARIAELEAKLTAGAPPPAALRDFKNPPGDPLAAQAELHRMLVLSAYDAATDPKITAEQRRKEIRTITAAAAKLFPEARRWAVDQFIRSDRHDLEKRAIEKRGARLVRKVDG